MRLVEHTLIFVVLGGMHAMRLGAFEGRRRALKTRKLLGGTEEKNSYPDKGSLTCPTRQINDLIGIWPPSILIACNLPGHEIVK